MVALEPTNHSVGIDLGLKEFAIASDGMKYANPKYLAKSLKRLKFLQKSLSLGLSLSGCLATRQNGMGERLSG